MKKYWISIVVLLLLAVILIFNTKDKSSDVETNPSVSEVIESEDTGVKEGCSVYNYDFDIPLPLEGVPEQILHRKGYVASYNKDNRIPNWVAWKLTAEHVGGKVKRPGNAWHEDDDVPLPRATGHDYKGSHWSRGQARLCIRLLCFLTAVRKIQTLIVGLGTRLRFRADDGQKNMARCISSVVLYFTIRNTKL